MTSPRGPLPARVYWVRRGLALLLALLLVFVIGKVLSSFGGNDGGGSATATIVSKESAGPTQPPDGSAAGSAAVTDQSTKNSGQKTAQKTAQPLSVPTGQCQDDAVLVTPKVTKVDGGGGATLPLELTTTGSACTWRVSSATVVLKITSGSDRIWSSQDCSGTIPTTDVVVRPPDEKAAQVDVSWGGRRSQAGCPKGSGWADPGYYHVTAASLGGTPTDVQFEVAAPPRPTVTKTAHPKPTKQPSNKPSKKAKG
jgi:hypothetical protein